MQYVIGLDEGTTGITALLFTQTGKLIGKENRELPIYFPKMGFVEQNPQEIFDLTVDTIRHLIKNANIHSSDIVGMGLTNQRETSILWNESTSEACGPAVSWQCKRSSSICHEWKTQNLDDLVREKTGLIINSYFSASKIKWLISHESSAQKALSKNQLKFGTVDTWLLWNFTQGKRHLTDTTNASRTMLYDLTSKAWSVELCKTFNIPMEILPTIVPSQSNFGTISEHFFGSEIPILSMVGDQQSALYAHGGFQKGEGKCTFGTGAFLLMSNGSQRITPPNGLLETASCGIKGSGVALEGSIFMAGAIFQWLRDQLKIIVHAQDTHEMILKVKDDHEIVMVPSFAGLGSPHWDENTRASIFGMSRKTDKNHIVKAATEAIAFQVYDLIQSLPHDFIPHFKKLGIDGGVTNNSYFCQFLADILQVQVEKSELEDMTALGAAKIAFQQLNLKPNFSDIQKVKTFVPMMSALQRSEHLRRWNKAIAATKAFHE